jgi:hypothetical protein
VNLLAGNISDAWKKTSAALISLGKTNHEPSGKKWRQEMWLGIDSMLQKPEIIVQLAVMADFATVDGLDCAQQCAAEIQARIDTMRNARPDGEVAQADGDREVDEVDEFFASDDE